METFLEKNGIKLITPAPYHPASNGLAERAVRSLKEGLQKHTDGSLNTRLCRLLYNHRRSIHSSTGKSPAEMLFGRPFKSPLESVKSKTSLCPKLNDEKVQEHVPSFQVEDAVYARNFGKGRPWVEGKIAEVLGPRNYKVMIQGYGNMFWKRHVDQLMIS